MIKKEGENSKVVATLDLAWHFCGTFMTPFLASSKGFVTSDLGLVKHSALSFIF